MLFGLKQTKMNNWDVSPLTAELRAARLDTVTQKRTHKWRRNSNNTHSLIS
jgi:KaiC/GvpD/RAD55 family RecA-like ATPase